MTGNTAAVDSSVDIMQHQVLLFACKYSDFRTHFCHLWKKDTDTTPGSVLEEWGIQKEKLVPSSSASDFCTFSFSSG